MNKRSISFVLKQIFIINLILISVVANAQKQASTSAFTVPVREEIGDLNGDGLADKVVIKMDTADITRPLQLEIFFQQKDLKYQLVASSKKLLAAQYHIDGKYAGNVIPDLMIEDGMLNILSEHEGKKIDHCFKFQNGNFELIYYFDVLWDGKNTTTQTTYNLASGEYKVESQQLMSDEVTVLEKKKMVVKPLPKLQDFVPFENQFY
ncbi:hypothetical protein D3C87_1056590 [compost metagenome]